MIKVEDATTGNLSEFINLPMEKIMSQEKVCISCDHEGTPIPQDKSSFIVDSVIFITPFPL